MTLPHCCIKNPVCSVSRAFLPTCARLLASPEPAAAQAVDLFTYTAARHAGALAASLGGLDGLVFTAGIGEHAPEIRAAICARLVWLGAKISPEANAANAPIISTADSRIEIRVIPTDEEAMIARHCLEHFPIRLTDIPLWRRNFYIRLG